MDAATLFNFTIEDFKNLASLLFSPAVALAAIYLFGVDLVKLPFIPTNIPYRVPARAVQVSALSLSFLFGLTLSAWFTLRLYEGPQPDVRGFMQQYFRAVTADENAWLKEAHRLGIVGGRLIVKDYDGVSDVRVFVNGVRVFGTQVDCMARHQCRKDTSPNRPQFDEQSRQFKLNTNVYQLHESNNLPLERTFTKLLRRGLTNYIEMVVNNSGIGDCKVNLAIELVTSSGEKKAKEFYFSDDPHDSERYQTIAENGSYRVCDRIRVAIKPS